MDDAKQESHKPAPGGGDLTKSKVFRKWGFGLGAALILVLTFACGVFVGLEKAEFSYQWGENYYRNFVGGMPPAVPGVPLTIRLPSDRDYMNAHGITGELIKIDGNTLIIKDDDGTEKNIIVNDQTLYAKNRQTIKLSDLKINDSLVVIGSPDNQGQMQAKFIRAISPK